MTIKTLITLLSILCLFFASSASVLAQIEWHTVVGNPTLESDPDAPPCGTNNSQINQSLRDDFGIIIEEQTEQADCRARQKLYLMMGNAGRSSSYKSSLKIPTNPITLVLRTDTEKPNSFSGYAPISSKIYLWNFAKHASINSKYKSASTLLIHETGHTMRSRNARLNQLWLEYYENTLLSREASCYNRGGYLRTYTGGGTRKYSESLAEAITLYVHKSKSGSYGTINNLREDCPLTYAFVDEHVFNFQRFY